MNVLLLRLGTDVLLVLLVFLAPAWFTITLTCAFLLFFKRFVEAPLAGFALDTLYGSPTLGMYALPYPYFFGLLLLLILIEWVRPQLASFTRA